ncbi:hypothetical protein FKM82_020978 [Ascaphus truei]
MHTRALARPPVCLSVGLCILYFFLDSIELCGQRSPMPRGLAVATRLNRCSPYTFYRSLWDVVFMPLKSVFLHPTSLHLIGCFPCMPH